jgi:MSHA biogenesis protein MshJ
MPQQRKLADFRRLDKAHLEQLASIEKNLSLGNDQISKDRLVLEQLKKQMADFNAVLGQANNASSNVGSLLKELLGVTPGLKLVSLKTLHVAPFYTPEIKDTGTDKKAVPIDPKFQKMIYKHGVEISVKGNYAALLSYMENLQKYPKRLFWSEARLDVATHPDAVLKLVIYSLSDQSSAPLR